MSGTRRRGQLMVQKKQLDPLKLDTDVSSAQRAKVSKLFAQEVLNISQLAPLKSFAQYKVALAYFSGVLLYEVGNNLLPKWQRQDAPIDLHSGTEYSDKLLRDLASREDKLKFALMSFFESKDGLASSGERFFAKIPLEYSQKNIQVLILESYREFAVFVQAGLADASRSEAQLKPESPLFVNSFGVFASLYIATFPEAKEHKGFWRGGESGSSSREILSRRVFAYFQIVLALIIVFWLIDFYAYALP